MIKHPSLFIFDKNSQLEGVIHYNTTLNNIANANDTLRFDDLMNQDDYASENRFEEDDNYFFEENE